jgi:hypothetical protein
MTKAAMTRRDELRHDIEALRRWCEPGAIDLRELPPAEIDRLLESVNDCMTSVISLRVALEAVRHRRRKSN